MNIEAIHPAQCRQPSAICDSPDFVLPEAHARRTNDPGSHRQICDRTNSMCAAVFGPDSKDSTQVGSAIDDGLKPPPGVHLRRQCEGSLRSADPYVRQLRGAYVSILYPTTVAPQY
jgi:hypothetical protein